MPWIINSYCAIEYIILLYITPFFLCVFFGNDECEYSHPSWSFHSQDCSGSLRRRFTSHLSRLHQFMQQGWVRTAPAWVSVEDTQFYLCSKLEAHPKHVCYHSSWMQNDCRRDALVMGLCPSARVVGRKLPHWYSIQLCKGSEAASTSPKRVGVLLFVGGKISESL